MRVESNIILGQKKISGRKIRMHWMVDEEYFPVKPTSVVSLDQTKKVIPLSEKWLKASKENFEVFTIPYYDYVYMKDFKEPNESYIVQPFSNDIVVIDIEIDDTYLEEGVLGTGVDSFVYLPQGEDGQGLLIEDFQVIGGFSKEANTKYTEEEIKDVDLKVGFNKVWKEDLEKLVEAYYYALTVTENSLHNVENKERWGE